MELTLLLNRDWCCNPDWQPQRIAIRIRIGSTWASIFAAWVNWLPEQKSANNFTVHFFRDKKADKVEDLEISHGHTRRQFCRFTCSFASERNTSTLGGS